MNTNNLYKAMTILYNMYVRNAPETCVVEFDNEEEAKRFIKLIKHLHERLKWIST